MQTHTHKKNKIKNTKTARTQQQTTTRKNNATNKKRYLVEQATSKTQTHTKQTKTNRKKGGELPEKKTTQQPKHILNS